MDKDIAVKEILSYYNDNYSKSFELQVTEEEYHVHIDFLECDKLNLRIDLLHNLGFYKKFSVKDSFIIKLFKDRKINKYNGNKIYELSDEDDLTVRYFEYLEFFEHFPNKLKHLDYICHFKDELVKKTFIMNAHRFITYNYDTWDNENEEKNSKEISKRIFLKNMFGKLKKYLNK